jgi:F-type H+-transporting ATPase subunit gamma
MAKTREIRNRIRSVTNTKKITRTMEMVATVKSKQTQDRLRGALPYNTSIDGIVRRLVSEAGRGDHPLFDVREDRRRGILLAISANRGFCGGYNSNIIGMARAEKEAMEAEGIPCEFHVSGKKATSFFRFLGISMDRTYDHFDDKIRYLDIEPLVAEFISRFTSGDVDEVRVVSYRFVSSSRQEPRVTRLLPMERIEPGAAEEPVQGELVFEFDPPPAEILEEIVPFAVKTALFTLFLEAATSEQIARRLAMKLATDNATDMIKELRGRYNRARQDQITKELSDIMGGAAAIEG